MLRLGEQYSDAKSQLVREICSIPERSISCIHKTIVTSSTIPPFIDWYHILGVKEDAGMDMIRRQYRRFALQLHPDKNNHPKAETAFKLVSEAYTSLSDDTRRKLFDNLRSKHFCTACDKIPYTICKSLKKQNACKSKRWCSTRWSNSYKFFRNFRDVGDQLKEEARVIENCMRFNMAKRKESHLINAGNYIFQCNPFQKQGESSVFDPSNYVNQGYPHVRTHCGKNYVNF